MNSKGIIRGFQFTDEGNGAFPGEAPLVKWLEYTNDIEVYEKRLARYLHAIPVKLPNETDGENDYKSYVSTEPSIIDFFCTGEEENLIVLESEKTRMDWISKAKRGECIAFSIKLDEDGMLSGFQVHCGRRRVLLALMLLQGLIDSDIERRTRRYMKYQIALRDINKSNN